MNNATIADIITETATYATMLADMLARHEAPKDYSVLDGSAFLIVKVMDDDKSCLFVGTRKDAESGHTIPCIVGRSYNAARWSRSYCETIADDLHADNCTFVVMNWTDAAVIDIAQSAESCEMLGAIA